MAQKGAQPPALSTQHGSKKRKEPPLGASNARDGASKRPKLDHRAKQRDARSLSSQTSSKALRNGELDVDKFVKAREYEIRALEEGMAWSKKALTTRAFQQVPKELRRRTASHNVKRVPKRLQAGAKREMAEDNTPTVTARKRKPTRHMRLRLETVKKLRALGARRKLSAPGVDGVTLKPPDATNGEILPKATAAGISTRVAKVKGATLSLPPVPKAKYRKRQINKSWLPTHVFHAKRAHMTSPKAPLWKFSIPLTPTAKCYRPMHRAASERGAVVWDTSYIATIGLEGQQRSIDGVLHALGLGPRGTASENQSAATTRWRRGTRVLNDFAFQREQPQNMIAPVTVIWAVASVKADGQRPDEPEKRKRKLFIRVHPSAFSQIWDEVTRLAKVAKPQVAVEDLRFEIGSIQMTGPSCAEALVGTLSPSAHASNASQSASTSVASAWTKLAGLTKGSALPRNVLLGFSVQDPRLHFPPRTIKPATSDAAQNDLLELLATWPVDAEQGTIALFDRRSRLAASSSMPSQKAINRRKSLAAPGQYPEVLLDDPSIPVLLYCANTSPEGRNTWTLLLSWRCVQPVWYSIVYYPLSTGGQPRFGGLQEQRQLAFESGAPWFPADFPGTPAGWAWEVDERKRRKEEYERRPKSKRISWEAVNLGDGRKGEVGSGWACVWERLLLSARIAEPTDPGDSEANSCTTAAPPELLHTPRLEFERLLRSDSSTHADLSPRLATVRLTLLSRGVPQTCARIYRLPSASTHASLLARWLAQQPSSQPSHKRQGPKHSLPRVSKDEPAYIVQRRLAQALLEPPRPGESSYPACPPEEDLVGFVTTGNFNLSEGQGTGIGSIMVHKIIHELRKNDKHGRLCIVRNAGNEVGRLARFELV